LVVKVPFEVKVKVGSQKVDHIDNVVFGVLCLDIGVILNKISIQSMNHIYDYLARLGPKGICDKVFES